MQAPVYPPQPGVTLLFWEVERHQYELRDSAVKHCRKYKIPLRKIQLSFKKVGNRP